MARSWPHSLAGLGRAVLTSSLVGVTEVTVAPAPSGPDLEWAFRESVCVLTLADKLMEETEELCLQREQREVGARWGCSELLPLPTASSVGP